MSILRLHGRFILVVVVCLAVAYLSHTKIKPIGDEAAIASRKAEDAMRGLVRTAVADVKRSGTTANIEIGNRRAWVGLLETLVARQATELSYQEIEDFRIPAELSGDEAQRANQYAEVLRRVQTRLGYARYWGPKRITGDSSGKTEVEYDFGAVTGVGATPIPARLIRLDLLTRAALCASASSSSPTFRVVEFRFKEPELEKLKARIPSVEVGRIPGPGGEVQAPRAMLGRIEAVVTVRGSVGEIQSFLALIQHPEVDGQKGRAVYFENFKISKEDWRDSGDDLVTLTGTLAATRVAIQAPLPPSSIEIALSRQQAAEAANKAAQPTPGKTDGDDSDGAFSSGKSNQDTGRRRPGGGR